MRRDRPLRRLVRPWLLASSIVAVSSGAAAGEPVSPIYGGDEVETCAWPTAVAVVGSNADGTWWCGGVLVHPQVVVYAAGCLGQVSEVRFGELRDEPQWIATVNPSSCAAHPEYANSLRGSGKNFAYCVLEQPVTEFQVIPPMATCEQRHVMVDAPVTLVGFGYDSPNGLSGVKRAVTTAIRLEGSPHVGTGNAELWVGGDGDGACFGDVGGPAFFQMPDGTWRVLGTHSWYHSVDGETQCQDGSSVGRIAEVIDWIETSSGIDISPCHQQGEYSPDFAACSHVPLDPGGANGSWPQGCRGSDATPANVCTEGNEPPTIEFFTPEDGELFVLDGEDEVQVSVSADVRDIDGRVVRAELIVDGEQRQDLVLTEAPWEWELTLEEGTYELEIAAEDSMAASTRSGAIEIEVGEIDEPGDGDPFDEPTAGIDLPRGPQGCRCSLEDRSTAPWWLAMLVAPMSRRRRRRPS
jgi:MYXO-CTERM domain-containing protein